MLILVLSVFTAAGLLTNWVAPTGYAQSNISGDISGTVMDASGAAVPNAQVTITNLDNNLQKVSTTDPSGNFRVPLLPPGRYKVSATSTGFSTATTNVGETAREVCSVLFLLVFVLSVLFVVVSSGLGVVL